MNFGNLKIMVRARVPKAGLNIISNEILELAIKDTVIDVAAKTQCLKKNTTITLVEDTATYSISGNVTDYLLPDDSGIMWYDGNDWRHLDPVTYKSLDEDHPLWRDDSSGDPQRYYIEGDTIGLHPAPDTAGAYAKLYYIAKPAEMTAYNHFPFHLAGTLTTEIPHLSVLSESIILGACSKLLEIIQAELELSKSSILAAKQEYEANVDTKRKFLNIRPDIANDRYAKMRGPRKTRN